MLSCPCREQSKKITMNERYDYHTGLMSYEKAEASLEDSFATGDILPSEQPKIESYRAISRKGKLRRYWKITLLG